MRHWAAATAFFANLVVSAPITTRRLKMRFGTIEGKHMFNKRLMQALTRAGRIAFVARAKLPTKKEPRIKRLSGV